VEVAGIYELENSYLSYLALDLNALLQLVQDPLSIVARGEIEQFGHTTKNSAFSRVLSVEVAGIEPASEKVQIKHLQA